MFTTTLHALDQGDEWSALAFALCWCERISREVYRKDPQVAARDIAQGAPMLQAWTRVRPEAVTAARACVELWLGQRSVPGWPPDGLDMERWGRLVATLECHRELSLLIVERQIARMAPAGQQAVARRAFLTAVASHSPCELGKVRALLHRQRRVVAVEALWGRPPGWRTAHLVVAAEMRTSDMQALVERGQRPGVGAKTRLVEK